MANYDPTEIYEISGAQGSFVALDVQPGEAPGTLAFHDTSRVRLVQESVVTLVPLTLASWNRKARRLHNPQAPRFESRAEMVRALRAAAYRAH